MGFLGLSLTKNLKAVQEQLDRLTKSQCKVEELLKIATNNVESYKVEMKVLQDKLDYFEQSQFEVTVARQGEELAELNEKVKTLEQEKKKLLQHIGSKEKEHFSMSEAIKKLTFELASERAAIKVLTEETSSDKKENEQCCNGNSEGKCCKKKKNKKQKKGHATSQEE